MRPETKEVLERSALLRFVPLDRREELIGLFHEQRFAFGEVIVRQGEDATAFYVVISGRARVVKKTEDGSELALNMLKQGDEFGETALLSQEKRTATIRASSTVETARLDRESFESALAAHPELRRHLELSARWRALRGFLYEFSNFGRLSVGAIQALVEQLEPVRFAKGSWMIEQGAPPGPLYIIRQGKVRVVARKEGQEINLRFLREGDYFGELSILDDSPRTASVQAASDCELLALTPETVRRLRTEFPEFGRLLEERLAQYHAESEARVPLDFAQELLPAEAMAANKVDLGPEAGETAEDAEGDAAPFEDEQGLFRKKPGAIRRFPFIRQIDEMDCGAACLAMICRHFGRSVSLVRIRQLCHTAHDGTSIKALTHAASELGLAARPVKASRRNLPQMPLPAIVHWEGNHWIVLYQVGPRHVRVSDPGRGRRRISRAEFEQKWTGYAALFDYTEAFEQAPETKSGLAWLWPFFFEHRHTLAQAGLLAGIATMLQLVFPVLTQVVVDKVIVENDPGLLKMALLAMTVAGLFILAANVLQQYLLSFMAVRLDAGILDFLSRRLLALPMSYFGSRRTGDIQRRLDGARQVRAFFVDHGLAAILALAQFLGALAVMGFYNLKLFFLFLLTTPLYGGLMYFSYRMLRPAFSEIEEAHGKYGSHQIDAIKGIEAVKAAGAELAFRNKMLAEFLGVSRKMFRGNFIAMTYDSAIGAVSILSTTLFLWAGANLVMRGEFSIGAFVAFNSLLALAYAALLRTLGCWDQLQFNLVLLHRLNDIFEQEPEQGRDRSRLQPVPTLEGRIELKNLSFRFGGPESQAILDGINLSIAPGKTVAIVGRSGSGKTTLIKLLAGLYEPTGGSILLDNQDLKSLNYRDVRRKFGLVLQENHVFSGTILANISFGDPEPNLERVLWAAQLANAHDFIMRLPLGYETMVGETGLALSGGQRQRISIARAVYHDPPILIFDEATSALDTESERAIQGNLGRLMAGRTALVIAHRLSTIRDADFIVVLEQGKVAEVGSHDELMARRGLYFYLSSQQLGL